MKKALLIGIILALASICSFATDYETTSMSLAQGPYTLQSAATTGNGNTWNTKNWVQTVTIVIDWSAGCSAGGVTIETADVATYAGTWAPLVVVAWSAASKQDVVQILAPVGVVRARISTNVVGGTVTIKAKGLGK